MPNDLSSDEVIRLESLRLARRDRDEPQSAAQLVAEAALIEEFIANGAAKAED